MTTCTEPVSHREQELRTVSFSRPSHRDRIDNQAVDLQVVKERLFDMI